MVIHHYIFFIACKWARDKKSYFQSFLRYIPLLLSHTSVFCSFFPYKEKRKKEECIISMQVYMASKQKKHVKRKTMYAELNFCSKYLYRKHFWNKPKHTKSE